jgi:L-cystine transport system permease protein
MRPFDAACILKAFYALLPYIGTTLLVTALSVMCGSILGILLAWARLSGPRVVRALSAVYVHVIRCTPSIVLLFIVYYGFPKLYETATGVRTGYSGKLLYVAATLSLLFAAAMCELFRSAYGAVDDGQREAAFCCGMTPFQTARLIIIPQALTAALPVFCSEVINLLKQGALAFTIGFIDLMGRANVIIALSYGAHGLETYIALAVIYWIISIVIEQIIGMIERRAARGKSVPGRDGSQWN